MNSSQPPTSASGVTTGISGDFGLSHASTIAALR